MNKLKLSILSLAVAANFIVKAQKSDGTTKSLLKAEKEFIASAKNRVNQAFIKFASDKAIVFRPNPTDVKTYYGIAKNAKGLSYTPNYAKVSKSGDWGVISGLFKLSDDPISYGHYLTVWKTKEDKWEYVLNINAETNKPLKNENAEIIEPIGDFKFRLRMDEKDIKARRDVILTNERTLNTLFKTYGANAFFGFLSKNSRLMFPGTEIIVGKNNVQAFNNRMIEKINLRPVGVDRALGDDLAYTYGLATIDYKGMDLRESFNYVYVWERQADGEWNIISQIYSVAER